MNTLSIIQLLRHLRDNAILPSGAAETNARIERAIIQLQLHQAASQRRRNYFRYRAAEQAELLR